MSSTIFPYWDGRLGTRAGFIHQLEKSTWLVTAARMARVSMRIVLCAAASAGISSHNAWGQNHPLAPCPHPEVGSIVPEAEDLESRDGVLNVSLTYRNCRDEHGRTRYSYLDSAGRAEFVVKGPPLGEKASLVTRSVDTGPDGENDPPRPLATLLAMPDAPEPCCRLDTTPAPLPPPQSPAANCERACKKACSPFRVATFAT